MTLLELLVALAVLGLCAGLAFSNLGPWLAQSRQARNEAAFWTALAPTQLTLLPELAAAAVDPDQTTITTDDARLRIELPRLSSSPVMVELHIETQNGASTLSLASPALGRPSLLLTNAPPLRFASQEQRLALEALQNGAWRSVAVAALAANAPQACAFDSISRSCR